MSKAHGNIKEFEQRVMWEVPDFFHLPFASGYFVDSPEFQLSGGTWCLRLFPWQKLGGAFACYTSIWLVKLASSPQKQKYWCSIIYLDEEGKEQRLTPVSKGLFGEIKLGKGKFVGSKFTMSRPSEFPKPNYIFTVACRVIPFELSREATSLITTETKTPKESPGVEKLHLDLKKLLKSGAESDLLVVVSGREFRVHKNILRVRSAVFDAMFEHETVEKKSGKVAIEDLDPYSFRDFLEYMYTGRVEVFSDENVFGLYAAADKYDVRELKSEALEYMQRTLSLETFCDVMSLVLLHRENDLMEHAIDFFKKNLSKIIVTVQWQTFMRDHGTAANELLVKAFVPAEKK